MQAREINMVPKYPSPQIDLGPAAVRRGCDVANKKLGRMSLIL